MEDKTEDKTSKESKESESKELDIKELMEVIPHRYPFLLVDRILEVTPGEKARGLKNVTINEPFFQGHFPGEPVMPGVLMVEALAQVGCAAILSVPENRGKLVFFAGINKFRFKGVVRPGDQLLLEVNMTQMRGSMGKGEGEIKVEDKVVASGELMFAVTQSEAQG